MIEYSCQFGDESLAERLEEWFCEWLRSPWMLERTRRGQPYRLSGFFPDADQGRQAWDELRGQFPDIPEPATRILPDEDWKEAYKIHFAPWSSRGLHWVPAWERDVYVVPEEEHALYLDPGMAFGTGNHETTRLCAERLLDYRASIADPGARRIIDAGCGSGILALSARLLGFGEVFGFDNDPEAIRVSRENRSMNPDTSGVEFGIVGLAEGLEGRTADLILANIQADVLMVYAEEILWSVAPEGTAALSGILASEVANVGNHFRSVAEKLGQRVETDRRVLGEWADLRVRRV